jgi:hypothetical protein
MPELERGEAVEQTGRGKVEMPSPTYWPMVLAFGLMLLFAGVLTHYSIGVVGLLITGRAARGWWRDVIPHERHELVPVTAVVRPEPTKQLVRSVQHLQPGRGGHRVSYPEKVHPYSAGIWAGLAGGAVMALLACLYGFVAEHSVWYPVNLLSGVVLPRVGQQTVEQLRQFDPLATVVALIGHVTLSILVGIVYAAILPMFPKNAPLWGGILVPLFWTGLTATTLGIVNPALNRTISWPWFVACQLAYGLVAGFVIARSAHISTAQSWDFAARALERMPITRKPGEK